METNCPLEKEGEQVVAGNAANATRLHSNVGINQLGAEIHIARLKQAPQSNWDWDSISLEEWRAALRNTPGIRPKSEDKTARNPATGNEVKIRANPDVAEVYDSDSDTWTPLISWEDGSAYFYPPPDEAFLSSPMMTSIVTLSSILEAVLLDDRTGEILR